MVYLNPHIIRAEPWSGRPGWYLVRFKYNPSLKDELKSIPGFNYGKKIDDRLPDGVWVMPEDVIEIVREIAASYKYDTKGLPKMAEPAPGTPIFHPKLFAYQNNAVAFALRKRRCMFAMEMRLGKTPSSIITMREAKVGEAILIVPAMTRLDWADAFDQWWPGHPAVEIVETGKEAQQAAAPIVIASYELAAKVLPREWDAVIIDESHYVANGKAARSAMMRNVVAAAKSDALVIELTGTPIMNRPKGLHNQIDLLYPGRLDKWGKFNIRYSEISSNGYSDFVIGGLKSENADELRRRFQHFAFRVTRTEVEHLFPPQRVETLRVRAPRAFNPRELLEQFTREDTHNGRLGELIRAAGAHKVDAAVELAQQALESGDTHVAIMTHLKATAAEIAAKLTAAGIAVVHVDGDIEPGPRARAIRDCEAMKSAVLVSTMHAVNVGLKLAFCTTAIFAELYWTPGVMAQALGRFSLIGATKKSNVILLVLEGTQDEVIAARLLEKTRDGGRVVQAGHAEGQLETAIALSDETSDEEWLAMLKAAAASKISEEYL
jgi:SWI/SNF-related matrix-associated actin-dependent regulator of chromatin subfamily A-like protein 1